jgi:hypothetical protein
MEIACPEKSSSIADSSPLFARYIVLSKVSIFQRVLYKVLTTEQFAHLYIYTYDSDESHVHLILMNRERHSKKPPDFVYSISRSEGFIDELFLKDARPA